MNLKKYDPVFLGCRNSLEVCEMKYTPGEGVPLGILVGLRRPVLQILTPFDFRPKHVSFHTHFLNWPLKYLTRNYVVLT